MPPRPAARRPHRSASLLALLCLALSSLALTFYAVDAPARERVVSVEVVEQSPHRIRLAYRFGDFTRRAVAIDGQPYTTVHLGSESLTKRVGAPALPDVSRSVIIPDDARMAVRVLDASYHDVLGIDIAPSRGYILRSVDPADVDYTFGTAYRADRFYPAQLATLREPHIMRDHRGIVVTVNPLQYNPIEGRLRVYTAMTVELTAAAGEGAINVLQRQRPRLRHSSSFDQLYRSHFINHGMSNGMSDHGAGPDPGSRPLYAPLIEEGDLLIIAHDAWVTSLQPLATHKQALGIPTTIVAVSSIGNNATAIKNHIQSVYDSSDLGFVLLAGDAEQVAPPYHGGSAADPLYALLAGDDSYPEIMVGRFSAQNPEQLGTQIERTIAHEQPPVTEEDWYWRGMGIASNQGPGDDGELDFEHINLIRDDLLAYGYTEVDQIYDPFATKQPVIDGLNAGRGIVNYCGHGSPLGWSTSGFTSNDVNELVNDGMLPFVLCLACNNGQFPGMTCFAESWMQATHDGVPTGAVAVYACSQGQYWDPPMAAEDETIDLYVSESYVTFGTLCYAGCCLMMDEYPNPYPEPAGGGVDMFYTWIYFGDPSLRVVTDSGLRVAPIRGFEATGPVGGPFTPASGVFTLTNRNPSPIDFSVSADAIWIDLDASAGTIPPFGEVLLTASINAQAAGLGDGRHEAAIDFSNITNHDGDTTRNIVLDVGGPRPIYSFNMDADPGWSMDGEWALGEPTGGGGTQYGNPDPTSGATDAYVCGVNLQGDYSTVVGGPYYLTTGAIDCSALSEVSLHFQRWLNSDYQPYVFATIDASSDSMNWGSVWQNPGNPGEITDDSWTEFSYDIAEIADHQPTVHIRWGYQIVEEAFPLSGWNLDDVVIVARPSASAALPPVASTRRPVLISSPTPNPGRSLISLALHVPSGGPLQVRVVNALGRVVRTLHRGHVAAGDHAFAWDVCDERGVRVSSGVYFVVTDGVARGTRKAVVLR